MSNSHPDSKNYGKESPKNEEHQKAVSTSVKVSVSSIQDQISNALKGVDVAFKFEKGKARLTLSHSGSDAGVLINAYVSTDNLLDKLEQAIPGDWDKGIIAIIKVAINSMAEEAPASDDKKK